MEKKINFPWVESPNLEKPDAELGKISPQKTDYSHILGKILPVFILIVLVALVFFIRNPNPNSSTIPTPAAADVVVSVLPIAKGQEINSQLLKQIPVEKKSFSKKQLLELLNPSDIEKVDHSLRAKKDIAPNKPIFWSDLTLIKERLSGEIPPARIYYSGD